MGRFLKEGQGWRLGWDSDAAVFKGLVGGDRWAVEMTQAEFADFCRLTLQLVESLHAIAPELMAEERVACEQETDTLWVEVEGMPAQYSLRFILHTGRKAEGGWTPSQTHKLVQAIPTLQLF